MFGRIAQLARAPRLHRGGRGFKSLFAHYFMYDSRVLKMLIYPIIYWINNKSGIQILCLKKSDFI